MASLPIEQGPSQGRRVFRAVMIYVECVILAGAILSIGERMLFVHADYPAFLMTPAPAHEVTAMREECGQPLEARRRADGTALVRCGTLWPFSSVWAVPVAEVSPLL